MIGFTKPLKDEIFALEKLKIAQEAVIEVHKAKLKAAEEEALKLKKQLEECAKKIAEYEEEKPKESEEVQILLEKIRVASLEKELLQINIEKERSSIEDFSDKPPMIGWYS